MKDGSRGEMKPIGYSNTCNDKGTLRSIMTKATTCHSIKYLLRMPLTLSQVNSRYRICGYCSTLIVFNHSMDAQTLFIGWTRDNLFEFKMCRSKTIMIVTS